MELNELPVLQSPPGAEVLIDGRRYLYFAGTSYLGLAGRPEVIDAACEATRKYGVHTATSRAGYGNNPATLEVERLAAEFFGREDAFYFASGYVGNHILIQAAAGEFDVVFIDEYSHYSVQEAAKLCEQPVFLFRHRDTDDLRARLAQNLPPRTRPLVITDGVFSLTGAVAPMDEYVRALLEHSPAALLVDDAHGLAVLGEHGRGTLEQSQLWTTAVNGPEISSGVALWLCGTTSKAIGGFGGIIPGTHSFVDRARSSSHYFDGASAPPSASAGATAKALEIIQREPELRERLGVNARQMRAGLRTLGFDVEDWPTPNIALRIGQAANMRRIHAELKARDIIVPYIAAYAGSGKEGVLRVAVFATHTGEMIERFLSELRAVL